MSTSPIVNLVNKGWHWLPDQVMFKGEMRIYCLANGEMMLLVSNNKSPIFTYKDLCPIRVKVTSNITLLMANGIALVYDLKYGKDIIEFYESCHIPLAIDDFVTRQNEVVDILLAMIQEAQRKEKLRKNLIRKDVEKWLCQEIAKGNFGDYLKGILSGTDFSNNEGDK